MKHLRQLTGILGLLGGLCVAQPVIGADPVEEVRCAEVAFARALERGDIEAFASFIHPEARFVGAGVLSGREAVVEGWRPLFEPGGPRLVWRPQVVEVIGSGDLAFSRGPYRLVATGPDGEETVGWGLFNSTWQRGEDGEWQVVFDAGCPPVPEPPAGFEETLADPFAGCSAPAD